MYLSFLNYASYFGNILFFALLIHTFKDYSFKQFWIMAREKVKAITRLKAEIKKAEAKGEQPFTIPGTNVVIYAKTMNGAMYKYKERVRKFKKELRKKQQQKA